MKERQLSFLESPTGTGKTLSLLCGTRRFLVDDTFSRVEPPRKSNTLSFGSYGNFQDAVLALSQTRQKEKTERLKIFQQKRTSAQKRFKTDTGSNDSLNDNSDLQDQLADEYASLVSMDEQTFSSPSTQTQQLHNQVIVCTRTHGQIKQIIDEFKRILLILPAPPKSTPLSLFRDYVSRLSISFLASRAHLCINPQVLGLKKSLLIEAECQRLQKESNPKQKCPYSNTDFIQKLTQTIQIIPMDIEELCLRGQEDKACPYYACQNACTSTTYCVTPYNYILDAEARNHSQLQINHSTTIVFDEAHNVPASIDESNSVLVTVQSLQESLKLLQNFSQKRRTRDDRPFSPLGFRSPQVFLPVTGMIEVDSGSEESPENHSQSDDSATNHSPPPPAKTKRKQPPSTGISDPHKALIRVLSKILQSFNTLFEDAKLITNPTSTQHERFILKPVDGFLNACGITENLFEIKEFITDSLLLSKLTAFCLRKVDSDNSDLSLTSPSSLRSFIRFLSMLCLQNKQGWIMIKWKLKSGASVLSTSHFQPQQTLRSSKMEDSDNSDSASSDSENPFERFELDLEGQESSVQFVLMDTSSFFADLLVCRSIIFLGGTLSPIASLAYQLLPAPLIPPSIAKQQSSIIPTTSSQRFFFQHWEHIIKPNQFKAFIVSQFGGQSKQRTPTPFKFDHANRSSSDQLRSLWQILFDLSCRVPDGIVVFFSSYSLLHIAVKYFSEETMSHRVDGVDRPVSLSDLLSERKKLFIEKQGSDTTQTLTSFKTEIDQTWEGSGRTGAMMFCVVGGKMSEGINFSDGYARCVVVVGLPFPNRHDPVLSARLSFSSKQFGKDFADSMYLDLCMRAVNQSIGRCIRHKDDYATKTAELGIQTIGKLSKWEE
ncbi:putative ATP-dependent DNA helicase DDX11 [Blattamonas nauphoetae]|uniref:ATP-dependent DNA helicase DDX11 n=1 Tax=Blattamonas nauphoetae TaxID=2049346 RepID=A0ABQ9XY81_9EUKA|nr:putative ATP-dependent DNA helicase DDX11 [Blattamonas nauphoetae]